MAKPLKLLPLIFIIIVVLASLGLSGCSEQTGAPAASPTVQQPSSSSTPSSSTSGQSATPAPQQGSTTSGQQGSTRPGGPNNSKVMARAAEILGISESTFTSAFETAQKSVFGDRPTDNMTRGGQPPSGSTGSYGQPPTPPSGSTGSSGQGLQPPSGTGGGQQGGSEMMTKVYAKMATILNISADKISAAMEQAFKEVGNQTTSSQ